MSVEKENEFIVLVAVKANVDITKPYDPKPIINKFWSAVKVEKAKELWSKDSVRAIFDKETMQEILQNSDKFEKLKEWFKEKLK